MPRQEGMGERAKRANVAEKAQTGRRRMEEEGSRNPERRGRAELGRGRG